MEDKITIEKEVFKALASDTRIKVLKLLGKRRHTQSEIAADLKLSVPTVKEHLNAMEKAGLVKPIEEGYKWKYYELTEKSKCLLDPERKKVWIMLGLWIAAAAGTVIVFTSKLFKPVMMGATQSKALAAEAAMQAAPEAEAFADKAVSRGAETVAQEVIKTPFPYAEVIFVVALIVLTVLLLIFLFRSQMLKKHKVKTLTKK